MINGLQAEFAPIPFEDSSLLTVPSGLTDGQVLVPVRSRIGVAGSCNCQERCRLDGTAAEFWHVGRIASHPWNVDRFGRRRYRSQALSYNG